MRGDMYHPQYTPGREVVSMALACITGGKECDGCGQCQVRSAARRCPFCGELADRLYTRCGEVIGCECCVETATPEEIDEYD